MMMCMTVLLRESLVGFESIALSAHIVVWQSRVSHTLLMHAHVTQSVEWMNGMNDAVETKSLCLLLFIGNNNVIY